MKHIKYYKNMIGFGHEQPTFSFPLVTYSSSDKIVTYKKKDGNYSSFNKTDKQNPVINYILIGYTYDDSIEYTVGDNVVFTVTYKKQHLDETIDSTEYIENAYMEITYDATKLGSFTWNYLEMNYDISINYNYLTFTALLNSTIKLEQYYGSSNPIIYYKLNDGEYQQWNYDQISLLTGEKVTMYGNNPRGINSANNVRIFVMSGKIAASGNILSLIGYNYPNIVSKYCYLYMFFECSSLTTAPELPATTLADGCYYGMFYNCSKLNYVKCLATTNINTTNLYYWLSGVASSGTFVKCSSVTYDTSSVSGIPSGWTVQNI